ncbi:unnamed protein product [Owenia fusiformis]|uniref:Uncharacterized protein n=1 Tax=Owenia fusiformis TaxID=6347 RepID=A0A8J1TX07_OWEFU|nr:unnamed protein product [Owenia fusiformis]
MPAIQADIDMKCGDRLIKKTARRYTLPGSLVQFDYKGAPLNVNKNKSRWITVASKWVRITRRGLERQHGGFNRHSHHFANKSQSLTQLDDLLRDNFFKPDFIKPEVSIRCFEMANSCTPCKMNTLKYIF